MHDFLRRKTIYGTTIHSIAIRSADDTGSLHPDDQYHSYWLYRQGDQQQKTRSDERVDGRFG